MSLSRTCCCFLRRDDRKALGSVSKRLFVVAEVCEGPLRQQLHFIWQQVSEIVESLCNSFITSSALMVNGLVPANYPHVQWGKESLSNFSHIFPSQPLNSLFLAFCLFCAPPGGLCVVVGPDGGSCRDLLVSVLSRHGRSSGSTAA